LGQELADECYLVAADERIQEAAGTPQEMLPAANRQVHDAIEGDVMLGNRRVDMIALPAPRSDGGASSDRFPLCPRRHQDPF
jgi:hypothetical protein